MTLKSKSAIKQARAATARKNDGMVPFGTRLEISLKERLDDYCDNSGMSVQFATNRALKAFLDVPGAESISK